MTSSYNFKQMEELSYMVPGPKLSIWQKKINVVAADKVLCHSNDGTSKTLLTMMISRMLRYITGKLRNFGFFDKVPLERTEKDLPLARLEAINH